MNTETKLYPFRLEEAKQNKGNVVTRGGNPATFLHTNNILTIYPLKFTIGEDGGEFGYTTEGTYYAMKEDARDLFMTTPPEDAAPPRPAEEVKKAHTWTPTSERLPEHTKGHSLDAAPAPPNPMSTMKDQEVDIEKLKESMDVERIIKDVRSQKWTEDYRRGVATLVDIKTRLVRAEPLTQTQEENESLKFKLMAADRGLELAQKEENLELTRLRAELAAAREREVRLLKTVEKFFASCTPNPNEHAKIYVAWAEAGDILTEQEAALSATGAVEVEWEDKARLKQKALPTDGRYETVEDFMKASGVSEDVQREVMDAARKQEGEV